jgi:hypothetical protein
MAGQTITAVDPLLKDFYVDKIVEEIKQQMPLLDYFKKRDDMPTDGRQVLYPAHVGRNTGVGAIAAGGNLPTAGAQVWQDFKIPYRYNYARIQIDAQSLKQTKTSKGAFEKIFDAEIMGAARDCGRNRNRQLFGYGLGAICFISAGANSTTQTMNNLQGQTDANGQYNVCRFFYPGQILAGVTQPGGVFNWVGVVSTVNLAANTVTFTSSVNTSTGDAVTLVSLSTSTALSDTGYNNELMGLMGMLDDGTFVGTYQNISRTTYPGMQATRIALGQTGLSSIILQRGFDGVYQKSDGKVTDLFTHPVTLREHLANIQTFKRYTDEFSKSPDAGWRQQDSQVEIEFNEAPIHVDRDCPYGLIFGLDESMLFRYVNEEGKWADEDGTILLRVSGQDAYEARFRIFDNFQDDAPNRGFVISGIALSAAPETIQNL